MCNHKDYNIFSERDGRKDDEYSWCLMINYYSPEAHLLQRFV